MGIEESAPGTPAAEFCPVDARASSPPPSRGPARSWNSTAKDCCNKMMAVVDISGMRVIASCDAMLSIVKLVNGRHETIDSVPTDPGARALTVDSKTHRVYPLAAERGPASPAKDSKKGRAQPLPDTFHVLGGEK